MTEESLRRVEGGLAITLPREYWELMRSRGAELKDLNAETGGRLRQFVEISANDMLILNCRERKADAAMAIAQPKWWKQYLLFGTEGSGYVCVRLDGTLGVWKISADGAAAKRQCDSFAEYVERAIGIARKTSMPSARRRE